MQYYEDVITETIKAHNEKIYGDLEHFLSSTTKKLQHAASKIVEQSSGRLGNLASNIEKEHASQVPTCLVITSSESASSIETQFSAMIKQINDSVKAVSVVLDDKKCATMKQTIDMIQMKLRSQFGMQGSMEMAKFGNQLDEDKDKR